MFYLRKFPHPNIVSVYGAYEEKGILYMVMEHVSYSLRSKSVVKRVDLLRVLADVARALCRLHSAGHVHRDVKARNVLVTKGYTSGKLCDFGLARALPGDARNSDRDDIRGDLTPRIGPPKYRAPEVRDGEWYDQSSDMYGFGVMCTQLVGQIREIGKEQRERERDEEDEERNDGNKKEMRKSKEKKKEKDLERKGGSTDSKDKGHFIQASKTSSDDLQFIEQIGVQCSSDTPSKRPAAATCLGKILSRLGKRLSLCSTETAAARQTVWVSKPMDTGTGGKKKDKHSLGTSDDDDGMDDDSDDENNHDGGKRDALDDEEVEQRRSTGEKRDRNAKLEDSESVGDKKTVDTAKCVKRRRTGEGV